MTISKVIGKVVSIFIIYLMLNVGAGYYYLLFYQAESKGSDSENNVIDKPDFEVFRSGSTIYFTGYISEESIMATFNLIEEGAVTDIVVNSGGGNTKYAMDLAEWMLTRNIKLTVDELCFSSCANYFMPAAKYILVKEGAIVGWHGGAHQKNWGGYPCFIDIFPLIKAFRWSHMNQWKERERIFYETAGIHHYINVIGQHSDYVGKGAVYPDIPRSGWNYDAKTLKLLGFKNIDILDSELMSDRIHISIRVNQLSLSLNELNNFTY